MPTSPTPQTTNFTVDVLGRYLCNGLDEALRSADPEALRPDGTPQADARPFDVIVVGGGSFGAIVAQHLFHADTAHHHRVLVLDAGRFLLSEHVQNLPVLGLTNPPPTPVDPGVARNEVWGLPWRTDIPGGFPGLAYCLGGRSLYFGGWSPRPLSAELPAGAWPNAVVTALTTRYFDEASAQIGTDVTNDFIFGALHTVLRKRLFDGITSGHVPAAVPLAQLPLHLSGVPAAQQNLFKLEAPLAVQGQPPRAGFFPVNKFSTPPLLIEAARAAQFEARGDDVKKRLMVVPDCHVTRLVTAQNGPNWSVTAVETSLGTIPVPPGGAVVLALGTIESARLAKISFPDLPNADLIGRNLIAHLRSNLTIRLQRAALPGELPNELQASALFVKGQHPAGGGPGRHFHLQITAAGLAQPGADSEAELFKKVPDIDTLAPFRTANDNHVVITIRGIGEMEPQNPGNRVTLDGNDEFTLPRAFVTLQPTANDGTLWDTMDGAADDVAKVFAAGQAYEVLTPGGWAPVGAGQAAVTVAPFTQRRDGLGSTHHEAGTLWMGDIATASVTAADARFHFAPNAFVAGPALFPTVGSPNPMLTGTALARRLADQLASHVPPTPDAGFTLLFDGTSTATWRMSKIKNQPGRDDPGRFLVVDGTLEAVPGTDLGLFWCTTPTPPDFVLKLEWLRWLDTDNSGVFVRFPHPDGRGYDNTAFVGVDFGFEVQIDERARPDGADIHRTGAIYDQAGQTLTQQPAHPPGQWNQFEIRVQGQTYTVSLNGTQVTSFPFTAGSDPAHPDRGLPSTPTAPRFVGLQPHTGRVAFRNIQIKAI